MNGKRGAPLADFSKVDYSRLARKLAHGLPEDIIEDAVGIAQLAVLMAEKSYDESKGASKTSWAWFYVMWKVRDFVKAEKAYFRSVEHEYVVQPVEPPDPLLEKTCEDTLTDLEWEVLSGYAGFYEDPKNMWHVSRECGISKSYGYQLLKSARMKMREVLTVKE